MTGPVQKAISLEIPLPDPFNPGYFGQQCFHNKVSDKPASRHQQSRSRPHPPASKVPQTG